MIPAAPPSSSLVTRPRLLHDSIDVVRYVASRDDLFLPVLALSWFWLVGGTLVSGLPVFSKDVLFADEQVVTLMLALFAIGIAAGSLLAERLLRGDVSARYVPISGLAMAAFAFDLFLASAGRVPAAIGQHLVRVHPRLSELARARRPGRRSPLPEDCSRCRSTRCSSMPASRRIARG